MKKENHQGSTFQHIRDVAEEQGRPAEMLHSEDIQSGKYAESARTMEKEAEAKKILEMGKARLNWVLKMHFMQGFFHRGKDGADRKEA